jgi:transcriptional regulator with XRE-family HTH domain
MSMFDDIEADLGFEPGDEKLRLAQQLVAEDRDLIEALIALRLHRGLTQTEVAEQLDRNKSVVSNFERLGADPRPSTIRRYAVAVGARIRHIVEDAYGNELKHSKADGWVTVKLIHRDDRSKSAEFTTRLIRNALVHSLPPHNANQRGLITDASFIIRGQTETAKTAEHERRWANQ